MDTVLGDALQLLGKGVQFAFDGNIKNMCNAKDVFTKYTLSKQEMFPYGTDAPHFSTFVIKFSERQTDRRQHKGKSICLHLKWGHKNDSFFLLYKAKICFGKYWIFFPLNIM